MRLENVKQAWNEQADEHNQWNELDADERVEFALEYVAQMTRQALDDLGIAVYRPDKSALSVAHALGHVQHYLSTPNSTLARSRPPNTGGGEGD